MSEKTPREQIALLKNVIEDLQERVQTASESIRAIVQTLDEQHDEAAQPDFERLRYESEKQAYEGHPAARSTMPELYFLLLVSVLTAADATQAQWRHLYRTAAGAGYEADVRDLLPDAYSLTDAKLIEAVDSIERDELVNAFVLDSLLLALLHEGDAAALLAYISDLFALLGAEKEIVSETMQAAKTIVAQDREAYLAMMADMEHPYEYERCCYLFPLDDKSVVNDLTQAKSIGIKHLTVLCVKAENMDLDLDSWQAEKITFQNCLFENDILKSSQKEIHFNKCTFYEKNTNTGKTWINMKKASFFTECRFKNIVSNTGVLPLSNAQISHCVFSDCYVHFCNLLYLSNSTITDSEFIRCQCRCDESDDKNYPLLHITNTEFMRCNFSDCSSHFAPLVYLANSKLRESEFIHCQNEGFETLICAEESDIVQCTFSNCKKDNHGDYPSIVRASYSRIDRCQFEQCNTTYIIDRRNTIIMDSTFDCCTCNEHIV